MAARLCIQTSALPPHAESADLLQLLTGAVQHRGDVICQCRHDRIGDTIGLICGHHRQDVVETEIVMARGLCDDRPPLKRCAARLATPPSAAACRPKVGPPTVHCHKPAHQSGARLVARHRMQRAEVLGHRGDLGDRDQPAVPMAVDQSESDRATATVDFRGASAVIRPPLITMQVLLCKDRVRRSK